MSQRQKIPRRGKGDNAQATWRPVAAAFASAAEDYDGWYDAHPEVFQAELSCLTKTAGRPPRPWLEVGVGTGRFAGALGVDVGIDVALASLALAAGRGLAVAQGEAGRLPLATGSCGTVFSLFTLCFLSAPAAAMAEFHRVLAPAGRLVVAVIGPQGSVGEAVQAKAAAGHPLYRFARLRSPAAWCELASAAGFRLTAAGATLVGASDDMGFLRYHAGIDGRAGCQVLVFVAGPAVDRLATTARGKHKE